MENLISTETLDEVLRRTVGLLPLVLGSGGLLLLGWVLALACRFVVGKLVGAAAARLERGFSFGRHLRGTGLTETAPRVIRGFVFWVVLLIFAVAAIEQLPFPIVSQLLQSVALFLPRALVAAVVVLIGAGAGRLANQWVRGVAEGAGLQRAPLLGRIVQGVVLVVAFTVGAQQIGLESGAFTSMLAILLGSALGAMALAFGLGSSPVVTNIMAAHYAAKDLRIGQVVRLAGTEGILREICATSIVLDVGEDRVHLPARKYCEEACAVLGMNR